MSEHIETLDRPLMGVRQYRVHDEGYLGSLTGRGSRWEPDKPRRAECEHDSPGGYRVRFAYYDYRNGRYIESEEEPHSAPDPDCGCGYYAWYPAATEDTNSGPIHHLGFAVPAEYVRAVVSAWGDVVLHETGFRSEWMQVEALIVGTSGFKHLGTWIDLMPAWEALAERNAVPLIEEEDVDTFCRERGEVLDSRDLQAERREATKTAQESLSELHKSLQRMSEEMKSSRIIWGEPSVREPMCKTNKEWQAALERKRNQPAFWRPPAGGDVHSGHGRGY